MRNYKINELVPKAPSLLEEVQRVIRRPNQTERISKLNTKAIVALTDYPYNSNREHQVLGVWLRWNGFQEYRDNKFGVVIVKERGFEAEDKEDE